MSKSIARRIHKTRRPAESSPNCPRVRQFGIFIAMALVAGGWLAACSDDNTVNSPQETVTAPSTLTGPTATLNGKPETFSAGGASSSLGHSLEYRFDWGDGSGSPWSCDAEIFHSWSSESGFTVKAQARCKTHTDKASQWSVGHVVTVGEFISPPNTPAGSQAIDLTTTEDYSTGGSTSSAGHEIEYRFDWGDGNTSLWSTSPTASYGWWAEGDFEVKAQARCVTHTDKQSQWSGGLIVTVGETVSTPDRPDGQPVSQPGNAKVYCSGGAVSSRGHEILYQYDWEDVAFPFWSRSNCGSIYWSSDGNYSVRVRARCADHPEAMSQWSEPFFVAVTSYEVITTPDTPVGPPNAVVGVAVDYATGGSFSSHDHRMQYRFDWGNGEQTDWLLFGNASYTWWAAGEYEVKAQARCRDHTARISAWSTALTVTVR